jgi:rRNA-processing protein FCF1
MIDNPKEGMAMRKRLRGKAIKVILCDRVLREVQKVRGYLPKDILQKIMNILKRPIERVRINDRENSNAQNITKQYRICHQGDNGILSLCQSREFILVTKDKKLRMASEMKGVPVFHPLGLQGV